MAAAGAADVFAIVAAAGEGARLAAGTRKAACEVAGKPLAVWALEALRETPRLLGGVLVVHSDDEARARLEWLERAGLGPTWRVTAGGATRTESVRAGLALAPDGAKIVLVHDAARPLLSASDLHRVLEAGRRTGAAILATPVTDTLKRVAGGVIEGEVARAGLVQAQTPQVFARELLERAYAEWERVGGERAATDEAGLVAPLGTAISIVEAHEQNPKITRGADVRLAELLLAERLKR